MRISVSKISLASGLLLAVIVGSTAFALPPQASAHAQNIPKSASSSAGNTSVTSGSINAGNGSQNKVNGQMKACENRQKAVTNIISRINERTQNQLTLFMTIASRVEAFANKSGKKVANYQSLISAINSSVSTSQSGLNTLKGNSSFTCNSSNPKAMVIAFQGYLKTEISSLRSLKTAVKNLIVAVAQANGVKVSTSTTSQGGQS